MGLILHPTLLSTESSVPDETSGAKIIPIYSSINGTYTIKWTTILHTWFYIYPNGFHCWLSFNNLITFKCPKLCFCHLKVSGRDHFIVGKKSKLSLLWPTPSIFWADWKFYVFPKGFFSHSLLEATETDFIFLGSTITVDSDCSHEIKRLLLIGRQAVTNPDSVLKKQRHHFADKAPYRESYGFSNSHIRMCKLDHKEVQELMLSNCGAGEHSWKSVGQQRDQTSQS